jgi:hypothetical protein
VIQVDGVGPISDVLEVHHPFWEFLPLAEDNEGRDGIGNETSDVSIIS